MSPLDWEQLALDEALDEMFVAEPLGGPIPGVNGFLPEDDEQ